MAQKRLDKPGEIFSKNFLIISRPDGIGRCSLPSLSLMLLVEPMWGA